MEECRVIHDEKKNAFRISFPEGEAYVLYAISSSTIDIYHTDVPLALQNRGIGSMLAKHALQYAHDHSYHVKPSCTFVQAYMKKHPAEIP
jgi:uncharacterized protein